MTIISQAAPPSSPAFLFFLFAHTTARNLANVFQVTFILHMIIIAWWYGVWPVLLLLSVVDLFFFFSEPPRARTDRECVYTFRAGVAGHWFATTWCIWRVSIEGNLNKFAHKPPCPGGVRCILGTFSCGIAFKTAMYLVDWVAEEGGEPESQKHGQNA